MKAAFIGGGSLRLLPIFRGIFHLYEFPAVSTGLLSRAVLVECSAELGLHTKNMDENVCSCPSLLLRDIQVDMKRYLAVDLLC